MFLLVGIDHFTQWIKVERVATISATNVQKFIWKNIVCQFEIPNTLISDNGKQFIGKGFEEFLTNLGIKHRQTSVEHLQSNGQTEVANKVIIEVVKRELEKLKAIGMKSFLPSCGRNIVKGEFRRRE